MKKTLVLGASINPSRYSHSAVLRLTEAGHTVIAIGRTEGSVGEIKISRKMSSHLNDVDTVSIYLRPELQAAYYESILSLSPKRIIFNPGTENPEFVAMARAKDIKTQTACTLVLLSIGDY